jgi:hypothetical protein
VEKKPRSGEEHHGDTENTEMKRIWRGKQEKETHINADFNFWNTNRHIYIGKN